MRIGGSREGAFGHGGRPLRETSPAESGRALTVVETPARAAMPAGRGDVAFLAHLIATNAQAPQTRTKRRATPAEAIAAYQAMADLVGQA